jgi:hypothetical protein
MLSSLQDEQRLYSAIAAGSGIIPEPALARRAAGSAAPPNIWRKTIPIPAILKPLTPAPQGAYTVTAPTQLTTNNAFSDPKRQAYVVLSSSKLRSVRLAH